MKQSWLINADEAFPGSIIVSNRAFKIIDTRDESALLAVICPIQAAFSALARGNFVLFQEKDCFECLSPHDIAA